MSMNYTSVKKMSITINIIEILIDINKMALLMAARNGGGKQHS